MAVVCSCWRSQTLILYVSDRSAKIEPYHAHGLRGERWADQESSFVDMKQKVPERIADCCAYLEEHVPSMPFPLGELQVVSDAYLYVVLTWLKGDGVEIEDHPLLAKFQHQMNTHRSVQAVYEKGML